MDQLLALVLGGLASLLQGEKAKKLGKWNFVISFGACFVIALAIQLVQFYSGAGFDINQLGAYLAESFTASQVLYNTYFKMLNGNR